ncbi:hypothetical protein E2C01_057678 [Portunus trituberculatus]|uniref:FAS1 domain-containing protein n=1 Tax=Portunus trituberculatus TaxID=210409 RepID=A0A5B7H103_PORTR|nr:hypothetical protein [Portunus trituberculatus]
MNLLETAESLGATKWAQYIRESGLAGELEGAAAYTLFAPTNEAFEVSFCSSLCSVHLSYMMLVSFYFCLVVLIVHGRSFQEVWNGRKGKRKEWKIHGEGKHAYSS